MRDERRVRFVAASIAGALVMAGCRTPGMVPAVLAPPDAANVAKAADAMRAATGQARLALGPVDADAAGEIYVLPPPPGPLETHSLAVPLRFEVMMRGGDCFAVDPETGTAHALQGVACAPR